MQAWALAPQAAGLNLWWWLISTAGIGLWASVVLCTMNICTHTHEAYTMYMWYMLNNIYKPDGGRMANTNDTIAYYIYVFLHQTRCWAHTHEAYTMYIWYMLNNIYNPDGGRLANKMIPLVI